MDDFALLCLMKSPSLMHSHEELLTQEHLVDGLRKYRALLREDEFEEVCRFLMERYP